MGPSALVGVIALVGIEYAANGGQFTARSMRADPTFRARLERHPCYGTCPSYSVEIDATGAVLFTGERSVAGPGVPCQGLHSWKIQPAALAALQAEVGKSGFFAFRKAYRAGMTDQPTFIVTVTRHGATKTVEDYAGLSVGMPHAMVDLENAIDATANDRACVTSEPVRRGDHDGAGAGPGNLMTRPARRH